MQVLLFYILTQPSNDFAYRALELGSLYEPETFVIHARNLLKRKLTRLH